MVSIGICNAYLPQILKLKSMDPWNETFLGKVEREGRKCRQIFVHGSYSTHLCTLSMYVLQFKIEYIQFTMRCFLVILTTILIDLPEVSNHALNQAQCDAFRLEYYENWHFLWAYKLLTTCLDRFWTNNNFCEYGQVKSFQN